MPPIHIILFGNLIMAVNNMKAHTVKEEEWVEIHTLFQHLQRHHGPRSEGIPEFKFVLEPVTMPLIPDKKGPLYCLP